MKTPSLLLAAGLALTGCGGEPPPEGVEAQDSLGSVSSVLAAVTVPQAGTYKQRLVFSGADSEACDTFEGPGAQVAVVDINTFILEYTDPTYGAATCTRIARSDKFTCVQEAGARRIDLAVTGVDATLVLDELAPRMWDFRLRADGKSLYKPTDTAQWRCEGSDCAVMPWKVCSTLRSIEYLLK